MCVGTDSDVLVSIAFGALEVQKKPVTVRQGLVVRRKVTDLSVRTGVLPGAFR